MSVAVKQLIYSVNACTACALLGAVVFINDAVTLTVLGARSIEGKQMGKRETFWKTYQ